VLRAIGCEETDGLPPLPRATEDIQAWQEGDPCAAARPAPTLTDSSVYSIVTTATVGDATQSVEATVELGKGPITWKQRPVWGAAPSAVP
jgi:hypothetical protein